jgi:mono/diheme cytochrome c family protein
MKHTQLLLALGVTAAVRLTAQTAGGPTFARDVAPILQRNCQSCHRPGEAAPFSLLTYEDARPWAKAIKAAVLQKKMPPWFADPEFGKFSNQPSLSQKEVDTLAAWVDAGAPEGDRKDLPAPRQFVEGWSIPKPDIVFQLPKPFPVPATGVMEYQYVIIPTGFTKDTWVQAVQAAPTNYRIVHHICRVGACPGLEVLQGHAEE